MLLLEILELIVKININQSYCFKLQPGLANSTITFEIVSNHSLKMVGVLTFSFTRHDIDASWHGNLYISSVSEHDSVTE
jgi:hypothetical protein